MITLIKPFCFCVFAFFFLNTVGAQEADVRDLNKQLWVAVDNIDYRDVIAQTPKAAELIRKLLEKGADPNYLSEGKSLLGRALCVGHIETVKVLLEFKANPNSSRTGFEPDFFYATCNSSDFMKPEYYLRLVELLLDHGADPNLSGPYNKNALSQFIQKPEIIKLLLAKGANPNPELKDPLSRTPLEYAAEMNAPLESSKLLLEAGAKSRSELDYAVMSKNTELIDVLLSKHANVSPRTFNLSSELSIVEKLLKSGISPNITDDFGLTPLLQATQMGELEKVKLLLEYKADPNYPDKFFPFPINRPLGVAAEKGYLEIAKLLLDNKADIDEKSHDSTALLIAVQNSHKAVAELLLDRGADMIDRFTGNWRAMFEAAEKNQSELIKKMLAKGAKVDRRDKSTDTTALMRAVYFGNYDATLAIVEAGAELNAANSPQFYGCVTMTDSFSGTVLDWAERGAKTPPLQAKASPEERQRVIKLLLERGAKRPHQAQLN